jgi:hypothetical protein
VKTTVWTSRKEKAINSILAPIESKGARYNTRKGESKTEQKGDKVQFFNKQLYIPYLSLA